MYINETVILIQHPIQTNFQSKLRVKVVLKVLKRKIPYVVSPKFNFETM